MSANKRRLDQLKVVSPCSTDWDRMSGDEKKRFCSECDKFVYDFSQMTRRQVEAIVSIHRGRMCARITRRHDGSLVTLEAPPVHPIVARRASPVVNATLAAILGLSVPASALNVDVSAAQLIVRSDADGKSARNPFGGGEAVVGGTVFDPQGAVIPNAVVKLISDAGAELETKTSSKGEFRFAQLPFGAYIMLVEAQGFYTHVNSNVIVDTPYDTSFEVTMKENRKVITTAGAMVIDMPSSLLDLHRQSDLIAIAQVGRSVVAGTDNEMKLTQVRTDLRISSQLKGENDQQVIPFYHWINNVYDRWINNASPPEFKQGARLLVFLQFRKTEDGKRLDGFEVIGWEGKSIKELDDGALAVYRQRIEELTAIFRRVDPEPAEIVEWLIRCVEEPATREEGIRKLSEGLSLLNLQHERENEDKSQSVEVEESAGQGEDDEEGSNEQTDNDHWAEIRRENIRLAAALTQEHKTRLANALFAIEELNEDDMRLVGLIQELGDERLASYLVSQLRRIADRAPRLAESLVWKIAQVINDEDIRRLANDYDDAATYDESENGDGSDRQDSNRNKPADGLTVEAIKRGAMLKDFLKLVEYKTKR
jgi:carboxypeptidase family protein